jgi:hypothetical protein
MSVPLTRFMPTDVVNSMGTGPTPDPVAYSIEIAVNGVLKLMPKTCGDPVEVKRLYKEFPQDAGVNPGPDGSFWIEKLTVEEKVAVTPALVSLKGTDVNTEWALKSQVGVAARAAFANPRQKPAASNPHPGNPARNKP